MPVLSTGQEVPERSPVASNPGSLSPEVSLGSRLDLQVPYVDVNLEKYPECRYEMEEKTGRRTVPQIFFNSKHIGGYDDLKKLASHSNPVELDYLLA